MKIKRIEHIGIAVNSIEEAVKLYTEKLGLQVASIEEIAEQNVRTAIIPVGDTKIELLESTSPDGVIAKHIERRGEGVQHIALEVDDVQEAIAALSALGIVMIDAKPRKGVENSDIAFIHPRSTKVLLEIMTPGK